MTKEELDSLQSRLLKARALVKQSGWSAAMQEAKVETDEELAFNGFLKNTFANSLSVWLRGEGLGNYLTLSVAQVCNALIEKQASKALAAEKRKELAAKKVESGGPVKSMAAQAAQDQVSFKAKNVMELNAKSLYVDGGEYEWTSTTEMGFYTFGVSPCVAVAICNTVTGAKALAHMAEDQKPQVVIGVMMGKVNPTGAVRQCKAAYVTGQPKIYGKGVHGAGNILYTETILEMTRLNGLTMFTELWDLTDDKGVANLQVTAEGEIGRYRE